MKTVTFTFLDSDGAEWLARLAKQQIAQPEERLGRLQCGIMIDSIRKASAVSLADTMAPEAGKPS
jgi:hypothetical protein